MVSEDHLLIEIYSHSRMDPVGAIRLEGNAGVKTLLGGFCFSDVWNESFQTLEKTAPGLSMVG